LISVIYKDPVRTAQ